MADTPTTNLDAGTDRPSLARPQILEGVQRLNELAVQHGADLRIYGAKCDGTTDCWPPLVAAVTDGATRFRLAPKGAESGTAFFGSFDVNGVLVGKTLDFDERLTISVPDNACVGLPNSAGVRYARPTLYYMRSLSNHYLVHPEGGELWYGAGRRRVMQRLRASDADLSRVVALSGASFTARKIPWNNSDTWLADSFGSSTADAFGFAPPPDGALHFGVARCKPGDEFVARLTAQGTPLVGAVVQHTAGYSGVWSQADYNASTTTFFKKEAGSAGTSSNAGFLGEGSHGSYSALGSIWTIRIDSWRSASILLNGYAVARFQTAGIITGCGWGGYANGSGQTFTASGLVRVRGRAYSGGEFLALRIYGDSRSADRYDAWPTYVKDALEFAAGVRCWKVINRAVAGQDSSQQRALMATDDLSDTNHVHIELGTNNGQGQSDLDSFKADLDWMVARAVAAHCTVSLGVPGLWYTQGQAGSRGQASTYYDRCAGYRAAIYRVAGEHGVRLVDQTRSDGPVVAHYVNGALGTGLLGSGDPVVYDNIHSTTETDRRHAEDVAAVVLANYANQSGSLYLPAHSAGVAANGWQAGSQVPRVAITGDGWVSMTGVVEAGASPSRADGTAIWKLGDYCAPSETLRFWARAQNSGDRIGIDVTPAGELQIFGAVSSTWISVSGLGWQIEDREAL